MSLGAWHAEAAPAPVGVTFEEVLDDPTLHRGHSTVLRLYQAVLGREPEGAGAQFWIDLYDTGEWNTRRIANHFANSDEFAVTYGPQLNNVEFTEIVYRNVLGRPPDNDGFAFWVGQLDNGMTRGEVILLISNAPEFIDANPLQSDARSDSGPRGSLPSGDQILKLVGNDAFVPGCFDDWAKWAGSGDVIVGVCKSAVGGFDLRTGRLLWERQTPLDTRFVSDVQAVGEDIVYVRSRRTDQSGIEPAMERIELVRRNARTGRLVHLFEIDNDSSNTADATIYGLSSGNTLVYSNTLRRTYLIDETGSIVWTGVGFPSAVTASTFLIHRTFHDADSGVALWTWAPSTASTRLNVSESSDIVIAPDNPTSFRDARSGAILQQFDGRSLGLGSRWRPALDGVMVENGDAFDLRFLNSDGSTRWEISKEVVDRWDILGGRIFVRNLSQDWIEIDVQTGEVTRRLSWPPVGQFANWLVVFDEDASDCCIVTGNRNAIRVINER